MSGCKYLLGISNGQKFSFGPCSVLAFLLHTGTGVIELVCTLLLCWDWGTKELRMTTVFGKSMCVWGSGRAFRCKETTNCMFSCSDRLSRSKIQVTDRSPDA